MPILTPCTLFVYLHISQIIQGNSAAALKLILMIYMKRDINKLNYYYYNPVPIEQHLAHSLFAGACLELIEG